MKPSKPSKPCKPCKRCKRCFSNEHPVEECTLPEGKTPYQGQDRCFGHFNCKDCKRAWSSGNSWANFGQQCKKCFQVVYPHIQKHLRRLGRSKNAIDLNKPHPESLCEKCKSLGYNCRAHVSKKIIEYK